MNIFLLIVTLVCMAGQCTAQSCIDGTCPVPAFSRGFSDTARPRILGRIFKLRPRSVAIWFRTVLSAKRPAVRLFPSRESMRVASVVTRMPGSTWSCREGGSLSALYSHLLTEHGMPQSRLDGLSRADLQAIHDNMHNGYSWNGTAVNDDAPPSPFIESQGNTMTSRSALRQQGRIVALQSFAATGVNVRAATLLNSIFPKAWFNLR